LVRLANFRSKREEEPIKNDKHHKFVHREPDSIVGSYSDYNTGEMTGESSDRFPAGTLNFIFATEVKTNSRTHPDLFTF
jgi:hypothetical protein